MKEFGEALVRDIRAHGKATSGPFLGTPVLVLTTTGARSGEERVHPVVYTRDGERYIVVASMGGAPTHPSWYHNLRAHPIVGVEVGGERFRARAHIVPEPERRRLYDAHAAVMPSFAEYERRTARRIPVISLERLP